MVEQAWRPRRCVRAQGSGSSWVSVRPYYEEPPSQEGRYGLDEGRRKPPGSRGMKVLRFGPDETVPGWKTPQWSAGRRRVCKGTRTARCRLRSSAISALRSLTSVREEGRGRSPRRPNNRGDESRLHECACLHAGCLTIESEVSARPYNGSSPSPGGGGSRA